jgi:uncharacterized protein YdeI (YjbR/CyaY-like superfamily)
MNEKINHFFEQESKWKAEFQLLRTIVLKHKNLEEDYKWMHPCYTIHGKNVLIIHGFKEYCALLFFKGALMQDDQKILIQQTENVQAARQIRFTNIQDIKNQQTIIGKYIEQVIAIEKAGKKVVMKKTEDFPIPDEFQAYLNKDDLLNKAFFELTPGRQKAYLYFFNQAKQSKTKIARIEKYYATILAGKGMND